MLQGLSPHLVAINATTNKSQKIAVSGILDFGSMVIWGAGVSAGKFKVFTAPEKDFAGTWAEVPELEIDFASGGAANSVQQGSTVRALFGFIYVEAVTPVVGGTAKFYLGTDRPGAIF